MNKPLWKLAFASKHVLRQKFAEGAMTDYQTMFKERMRGLLKQKAYELDTRARNLDGWTFYRGRHAAYNHGLSGSSALKGAVGVGGLTALIQLIRGRRAKDILRDSLIGAAIGGGAGSLVPAAGEGLKSIIRDQFSVATARSAAAKLREQAYKLL